MCEDFGTNHYWEIVIMSKTIKIHHSLSNNTSYQEIPNPADDFITYLSVQSHRDAIWDKLLPPRYNERTVSEQQLYEIAFNIEYDLFVDAIRDISPSHSGPHKTPPPIIQQSMGSSFCGLVPMLIYDAYLEKDSLYSRIYKCFGESNGYFFRVLITYNILRSSTTNADKNRTLLDVYNTVYNNNEANIIKAIDAIYSNIDQSIKDCIKYTGADPLKTTFSDLKTDDKKWRDAKSTPK